ncbi:MAG: hypothetical protein J3K34DRAFT_519890 [Monoraphidium minutum]|nr:MAG: hypothetical protein J3K34DRAFT_519890 [Monoraphidium minutum]
MAAQAQAQREQQQPSRICEQLEAISAVLEEAGAGVEGAAAAATGAAAEPDFPKLQLPDSFSQLLGRYQDLQHVLAAAAVAPPGVGPGALSGGAAGAAAAAAGSVRAAGAVFMGQLEAEFGAGSRGCAGFTSAGGSSGGDGGGGGGGGGGGRAMPAAEHMRRLEYVAVVGAALWLLRALQKHQREWEQGRPLAAGGLAAPELLLLAGAVLRAGRGWQGCLAAGERGAGAAALAEAAALWRNRCYRSVLSAAAGAGGDASGGGGGGGSSGGAAALPLELWADSACWHQLGELAGRAPGQLGGGPGTPVAAANALQLLLPGGGGGGGGGGSGGGGGGGGSGSGLGGGSMARPPGGGAEAHGSLHQRPPGLAYSDAGQLVARSRLVQRVQELLLQARLEGGAPAQALLSELCAAAAALARAAGAPGGAGARRQGERRGAAQGEGGRRARGGGPGGVEEEERALTLFRLCHALLGGGGCHIVEVRQEQQQG